MRNSFFIPLRVLLGFFSLYSCSDQKNKEYELTQSDSTEIIRSSIQCIMDKERGKINPVYYSSPIMLNVSSVSNREYHLKINGKETEFLRELPDISKLDWKNPLPIIEVAWLKKDTINTHSLEIRLPTTGQFYEIKTEKTDEGKWKPTMGHYGQYKPDF